MSGIIRSKLLIADGVVVFIITGGGSGIGKALALTLAKQGKPVLIVGRREHALQETASTSPLIKYLCADVSSDEGLHSIKSHVDNVASIEGLVNNAGTLEPIVPIKDMTREEWHQTLRTNVDAPLFLSQLLYDKLNNGRVLNIGSQAAYYAIKGWSAYCASKATLAMLSQCWQLESDSVAFASVKPGIIDTDMQAIARVGVNMDPEHAQFYRRLKENNRLISPETVAEFLSWLLLTVDRDIYVSQEWDIYETGHHPHWLKSPHQVLHWDF